MIDRNQVWKFQGTLWRVEAVTDTTVELRRLLGDRTMSAMKEWIIYSPEWKLIYRHDLKR